MHRIIVVGGGAGGLELATRLGDRYGRRSGSPRARITLVDRHASHLWKPLLHEVASGSMDAPVHQVDYAAQAYRHGFEFNQGAMTGLDRSARLLKVDQVVDDEGMQVFPARELPYDTLVIAIGSTTNYFGVPGAREHTFALDSVGDAERFRRRLLAACARAHRDDAADADKHAVRIVIVGGGATGVELAAELRQTARVLSVYGLHRLDPVRDIGIAIVEAGPRILGALPKRVSASAADLLREYDIDVATGEQVAEVASDGLRTVEGEFIGADLIVWAAGIKALPVLADLDGLALGPRGQLLVEPTLRCENDAAVFALGDCAQCRWGADAWVPPRAQAAHQQASFLVRTIGLVLRNGGRARLPAFRYRDFGSLVSLGRLGATGNLMGGLIGGRMFVDGMLARLMYVSLYRMHTVALHGWWRTGVDVAANFFRRSISPRVKLH